MYTTMLTSTIFLPYSLSTGFVPGDSTIHSQPGESTTPIPLQGRHALLLGIGSLVGLVDAAMCEFVIQ